MSSDDRPRILCVDDDPDLLEALTVILEDGGWRVARAASAQEGEVEALEVPPDVAIVDLMLEEVDSGVTLATRLRARHPELPIFLLSSVGNSFLDTHDVGRLQITGILQKPIDGETLLRIVEQARRARRGGPTGRPDL
jgi:DNA-binding response OmpR family regulator